MTAVVLVVVAFFIVFWLVLRLRRRNRLLTELDRRNDLAEQRIREMAADFLLEAERRQRADDL